MTLKITGIYHPIATLLFLHYNLIKVITLFTRNTEFYETLHFSFIFFSITFTFHIQYQKYSTTTVSSFESLFGSHFTAMMSNYLFSFSLTALPP